MIAEGISKNSFDSGLVSAPVYEAARSAWVDASKADRDAALAEALGTCIDGHAALLPGVFERGLNPERPIAERRAFARQLGVLADCNPGEAERIFRKIQNQDAQAPGLMTAALEGIASLRERHLETLGFLLAGTMAAFGESTPEWRTARSVLFAKGHSGTPAYEIIQPALCSDRPEIRCMAARWLLPELVTKKQYGKDVLDLIENRLDSDSDPRTVRACIKQLPKVFARRPGQAKRITAKAKDHPHDSVRMTVTQVLREAGMAEQLR